MTHRVRHSEVPGAGSPLSRAVLAGPPRQAWVLASLPTALYLSAGRHHEVLPVLASDALMLPTGTRLSAGGRDIVWGVGPGDPVTVGDAGIALPGWRIRLVREWRPARVHPVSWLAEPELLSELADSLSCHASAPGLVGQASAVCRAARRGDETGVGDGVRHLLGAGQGLTPSGDDALCAVLLVLGGLGDTAASTILGAAVQGQWAHTTSLSASLLDAARSGYAVPQVAALVGSSLGGNLAGVSKSLTATLAIGHSSGRDLVAGVAGCLLELARNPIRRKGNPVTKLVEVRRGAYYDSVSLMQVSKAVREASGVDAALVAMATDLNIDLLTGMAFTVDEAVGPNDMLVAIRGEDDAAIEAGRSALANALAELRAAGASAGGFGDAPPPRTVRAAVTRSGANLALISVPGPNAFVEAMDAVTSGASVMLFSDNVSVEQEITLKDAAAAAGVLVMGPDCGTAVVAGVALGFANLVRAGSVGLVAASGTGAQQVMCLLDLAGVGMSHCLGVGGRDLSSAVGGRSTRQALAALAADPATESIIVVSKPPAPEVLAAVEGYAAGLGTPVRWATLGAGRPDLTVAVEAALASSVDGIPAWPQWLAAPPDVPVKGSFRGLFCGGTLADEAMIIAGERLGPIRSNIPLSPELALGPDLRSPSHLIIDFGDDALTQGRPHPMIDPSQRLERIAVEGDDPACGVLLLDLILGLGSHADPADELAAAITSARRVAAAGGRELAVVVSLIGVENDPQGLTRCATTLQACGASVFVSNAQATRHALSLLTRASAREETPR